MTVNAPDNNPADYYGGRDPLDPGTTPYSGADPGVVGNGSGVRQWGLGVWYGGNYPACVHFYEDRLCFAGAPQNPERIDMSCSSAYEVFSPSALLDDTVTPANAVGVALNSNTVNAIRWLQSDQNGLLAGTPGGEWVVSSASITEAISSTSITAKQTTEFGAAAVAPIHTGMTTLFLQAGARKLRELKYSFVINGFEGGEISPLAEHLTVGGFKEMVIQRTPQQILWLVRNDGVLVSVSYDANQNEVAFAPHPLGGTDTKVLSATVIPSPDATRDEVWLAVSRTINGSTAVYIERMSKLWEVGDQTLDTTSVSGTPFYRYVPDLTVYADAAQRYTSGTPVTQVTGATWLANSTVGVVADGAAHPDVTVSAAGVLTLQRPAKDIAFGFRYSSIAKTLPIEAGGADGPAQGKIQRIHRAIFRIYESSGWEVLSNPNTGDWTPVVLRETTDPMDQPVPLATGDYPQAVETSYERGTTLSWRMTQMLPLNMAGLVVQLETQDGG